MSAFQDRWVCHSLEHVLVPVCLGVMQFLRLLFVVSSSTVVHMWLLFVLDKPLLTVCAFHLLIINFLVQCTPHHFYT